VVLEKDGNDLLDRSSELGSIVRVKEDSVTLQKIRRRKTNGMVTCCLGTAF